MNLRLIKFTSAAMIAPLFLASCVSADTITKDLELAVDAAIAATPTLEAAAGVPAATQQTIAVYLGLAEGCLQAAAGAETTTGITAAGAAAVAAACGSRVTASPSLPPGTAANAIAAVTAVAAALNTFLSALPTASTASLVAAGKTKKFKLDQKRLSSVKSKLTTLDGKLHPKK